MRLSVPTVWVLLALLAAGAGLGFCLHGVLQGTKAEFWLLRFFRAELWLKKRWRRFLLLLLLPIGMGLVSSLLVGVLGLMLGLSFIPLLLVEWAYNTFDTRMQRTQAELVRRFKDS